MKLIALFPALLFASVHGGELPPDRHAGVALQELAPTGKLRVGVVAAPALSAVFVVQNAKGELSGVTFDLGTALARELGVEVAFTVAPNSGVVTEAIASGELDAAFLPVDAERRNKLAFGPAYFVMENTYLVRAGSDIKTLTEIDRSNVRVVGIDNTTTIRNAARVLKNTKIVSAKSVDEAMDMLRSGKADAFALTRDALPALVARLPGSRILDGGFQHTDIAVAVQKNKPAALAYVTAFMENAKMSGTVRRVFDHAGLNDLAVAPLLQP